MKTNFFLLSAIVALVVYSCSSDRDEQVQNPAMETKLDLKKVKTSNNQSETSKVGDSAKISTQLADPGEGVPITDPNDPEIIPPGDVKPPKGK